MKDKIFGVLQRVGRSFMLPIALLPVAGLLLGIGSSFTNETMLAAYGLNSVIHPGTLLYTILDVMSQTGSAVFNNLALLFAMGVAIGMARKEKEVAALSGAVAYIIMNTAIQAMINAAGGVDAMPANSTTTMLGITTLQMGVFGGIVVGLGVAALHNKFYKIELPQVLAFFGGTRFVPIVSSIVYLVVGIAMFYIWPVVQSGIAALGALVLASGYAGTFIYGLLERALIPFGLHHVFYMPFWQTAVGGTAIIEGVTVTGAQNIFFAELASKSTTVFSVSATRFMAGKFPFMMFGLPGAALAMYHCAKPEKKKAAGGICGEMDLGYITGCEAYGKVDGNNKVGGIAGHSSAKLISNWAKCELTGSKYIGGIVGQGADSVLTGNSCIIKDNRAMVEIHEPDDDGDDSEVALSTSSSNTDGQYWGAISGGQDGTFTGNLFVSDTLRGVDRISRAGQAEPIDYDTMRALEGAPKGFQKLTLTFMADGHIVDQRTFTYGASFTEADYPELPQKDGYLAEWNTPVLDDLHLDTVVTALYTSYTPALKSIDVRINGRPIFYVDGLFGGSNALSVTSQTPSGVANATEQWLLDFSDDGQETHTIRYLPQGKQGSVYVQQDGKWIKVPTDTFGSYITFTAAGTEIVMAFVPKGIPLWELCGGTVAALLVAAFLARKLIHKRKARKAKKNAAPVEELDTPIESDDQSTEQHTK